ncbi:type II toxin-antitoxin system RelE/ParE family toxin [Candidatus Tisiphia endosymbiont of Ditula angustiorana]|uniref:type II toxin-antitoxin system RelE family toxin n=1 Tax=Candidatus Tisiphia endosymbiont of Ditula angustiorana TaxID=3066272 RepID=UPI00312CB4AE
MVYKTKWEDKVDADLSNISPDIALKIYNKVENYLTSMPQKLGKPLIGKYKGLYRYRYGDYRILYEIDLENNLLIINKIGHRSNIY